MLREDHLKLLRTLLREIYRNVKQDLNLSAFSLGLMCERSDAKFRDLDPFLKVCCSQDYCEKEHWLPLCLQCRCFLERLSQILNSIQNFTWILSLQIIT